MNRRLILTKALNDAVAESSSTAKAVLNAIRRFSRNDWGNISESDKKANDSDYKKRDGRVLAKYDTPEGDIYITLDFDEPSLNADIETVMFCSEY